MEREKRSRTMFAQRTIKVDDVQRELEAVRDAIGSGVDVRDFVTDVIRANGGRVAEHPGGGLEAHLEEVPRGLRDAIGSAAAPDRFEIARSGALLLDRTHPIVDALAAHTLDSALDPLTPAIASRCGVMRTDVVERRTTVLLLRLRIHLTVRSRLGIRELLAEDNLTIAFRGAPSSPDWLNHEETERLLRAVPTSNIPPDQQRQFASAGVEAARTLDPHLTELANQRAAQVLATHRRVRNNAKAQGTSSARAETPVDVLGVYVFLPEVRD